ncbi:MAG: PP-loop domain-containing protein [Acidobacteria bacterium]|nr:PP-loop domain-containing protein [Acidobacteriota bacterium]
MRFEKQLFRKVGKAVHDFSMIRPDDRIAVGVSGGKDSLALLDALLHLRDHAPISFQVEAFTVEQGKFVRPIEPLRSEMDARGVRWTYERDEASFQLLEDEPRHGCDVCSRYRRRAVYDIAHRLGANVVALGHTADDFCEALLRNSMFTGRLAALPATTSSRSGDFRLIRPLVYVSEEITAGYCAEVGLPLTPCVCSFKTGTVRESLRTFLGTLRQSNPNVMDNLLAAMGRVDHTRLLDRRFLDTGSDAVSTDSRDLLPILAEETL